MKYLVAALRHPKDHKWGLRPWRRHSLVVLVAGCTYIAIGVTYILTEPAESRQSSLALALHLMPLSGWGVMWIAVGILAVISSRWPPASETWGYSALSGLAAWWAACYAFSVLMGAPNQSASGALLWGLVSFMWWGIAGLVNPAATLIELTPEDHARFIAPQDDQEA